VGSVRVRKTPIPANFRQIDWVCRLAKGIV
jgi:hypothetical protein